MMVRNRKGGMKKEDDYVELKFSGTEDYSQCVDKALDSLSMDLDERQEEACLFRIQSA